VSPRLRKPFGSIPAPTPAGVPVAMTSPARSDIARFTTRSSAGTSNSIKDVSLRCLKSPFTAIGERAVTERSVAAARAAWEEKQRARSSSAEGGGSEILAGDARGGDGGGVEALGPRPRQSHKKTADPADETSFARLGERSLMDDRFDELSVDLASIRGKQKGKGRGRGKR
jgi:hypothetical protein